MFPKPPSLSLTLHFLSFPFSYWETFGKHVWCLDEGGSTAGCREFTSQNARPLWSLSLSQRRSPPVCTLPCTWLCTPVTQGRCGPAGRGGGGGTQQKGALKRETLCVSLPHPLPPPPTSHVHTGWHPSSLVRRGIWEVAVQRAVQGLLRRPVRRRGPDVPFLLLFGLLNNY